MSKIEGVPNAETAAKAAKIVQSAIPGGNFLATTQQVNQTAQQVNQAAQKVQLNATTSFSSIHDFYSLYPRIEHLKEKFLSRGLG